MDTVPFHFLMFALDLLTFGVLIFWVIFRFRYFFGGVEPFFSDVPSLGGVRRSGVYSSPNLPNFSTGNSSDLSPTGGVIESSSGGRVSFLIRVKDIFWNPIGICVCGVIELFGILFFAYIFRSNLGQCFVEGVMFHVSAYLLCASILMYIKKSYVLGTLLFGFMAGLFVLCFDMLYIEPYDLVYEYYEIESDKVRYPLRVVFVADIQTDNIGDYERRTLRMINEAKGDMVILGGDYLQYYEGTPGVGDLPERFRQLFLEIPLEAKLGVYAIVGNIDVPYKEEFGLLFKDTTVDPSFNSEKIDGLGENEDEDKKYGPVDVRFLSVHDSVEGIKEAALSSNGNFTIVVGHHPNYAIRDYQFADKAPDLMLAGHTHGGQIYIPFWGPLRVKYTGHEAIITQKFLRGMIKFQNGGHLLITRGSGMERGWAPRVRLLCKPEISVIDITPPKKSN
jgi:predicted MPP superfamily phosphohydrolase